MTISCTMIRILEGMPFLNREMMRFDNAITTVTERAITNAGLSLAVTARAEHIPNINTVTGFALRNGAVKSSKFLLIVFQYKVNKILKHFQSFY